MSLPSAVYHGKYRGRVSDNRDPLGRGRLCALVPAISDSPLTWAEPCIPYAGPKVGWYVIPPVGANVWIEFERGDPDYPIWTGCFWGNGDEEYMPPGATGPDFKIFQTEKIGLMLEDKETRLTVRMETDNGPVQLVMDTEGIVLTADTVTLTLSKDKIELKKAAASLELSDSLALKNAAATVELSSSSVDLKNGASSISLSAASVSVNNGALEVM